MIVGDGMLARAFASRYALDDGVLVFASGVSNSQETSAREFERERAILLSACKDHVGKMVYFGTCSVADSDRQNTPYAQHKREMELIVLARPGGLVLRLPQVVGRTQNPHTLTNYLHGKISRGEEFGVWANAERNLIDVDDVAAIGAVALEQLRPSESRTMAIAARRSIPMLELVRLFEKVLGRKAVFHVDLRGAPLRIDASQADAIAAGIGIDLGHGYVERILRKYYGDQH